VASPSGAVMLSAAMFDVPSVNECSTPSRAVCFSISNGRLGPVTCSSEAAIWQSQFVIRLLESKCLHASLIWCSAEAATPGTVLRLWQSQKAVAYHLKDGLKLGFGRRQSA
jgi:TPP-dependent trihydroxycyclohexane-1,2-dione (THcHDO) dehydratase